MRTARERQHGNAARERRHRHGISSKGQPALGLQVGGFKEGLFLASFFSLAKNFSRNFLLGWFFKMQTDPADKPFGGEGGIFVGTAPT